MQAWYVLLCLFIMTSAGIPPRPKISETFITWFQTFDMPTPDTFQTSEILGYFSRSEHNKMELDNEIYGSYDDFSSTLYLFDQKTYYETEGNDFHNKSCSKNNDSDMSFEKLWDFLENSEYLGRHEIWNTDLWMGQSYNENITVAVAPSDPNTPLMVLMQIADDTDPPGTSLIRIALLGFSPTEPPKSDSTINPICENPSGGRTTHSHQISHKHRKNFFIDLAKSHRHKKKGELKQESKTKKKKHGLHSYNFLLNVKK